MPCTPIADGSILSFYTHHAAQQAMIVSRWPFKTTFCPSHPVTSGTSVQLLRPHWLLTTTHSPFTDFFPAFHHKTPQLTGNSLFLLDMEVTPGLINNLANLARLQFSEEEKAAIRIDLQRMIAFVEKLQAVDTTGTAP